MAKYDIPETDYDVGAGAIAVVAARFNHEIVDRLLEAALETLAAHGLGDDRITVCRVPGAFELPLAARRLALRADTSAVIALGAIIRGGTPHFEYVCSECARGLSRAGMDADKPVIFGVLTTDDRAQALARAGGEAGNKGREAALAALEMATLLRAVGRP